MNSSTLYGVRHGQDKDAANYVFGGHHVTHLTPLGVKQVIEAAGQLKDKNISAIYTSHFKPAIKTVVIISPIIGDPDLIISPELKERAFGVLSGRSIAENTKHSRNVLRVEREMYVLEAEGAENFPEIYKRAIAFLEFAKRIHLRKNILVVAPGEILKMLRAVTLNINWEEGLRTPYIDFGEIIELPFR